MAIRRVKRNANSVQSDSTEPVMFRVFCDGKNCTKYSTCVHEDPGELALKAKKERFVTVPGFDVADPMKWLCVYCNSTQSLKI
jgi:hypothetical protein